MQIFIFSRISPCPNIYPSSKKIRKRKIGLAWYDILFCKILLGTNYFLYHTKHVQSIEDISKKVDLKFKKIHGRGRGGSMHPWTIPLILFIFIFNPFPKDVFSVLQTIRCFPYFWSGDNYNKSSFM